MKWTHPKTKSKTRNRALSTFQKLPSSPVPIVSLLFRGNPFLKIRLLLSIIQMDFYSMFPFMFDSKMIVISDYVVAGGCHLFPFISISIVRILHSLFIHSILVNNFVVSNLGSFQIMLLQTFLNMSSGAQTYRHFSCYCT